MTLTSDQVAFFYEQGYLPVGKILEEEEIETLRREYDREFEKAFQEGSFRNLALGDRVSLEGKRSAPRQMLQIMQMCERNILFRRLIYDPRILDRAEDLLGPNIMLFHDQALYKPAYSGGPVFWHQDNAYWQCSPPNLVTCWLTLDDAFKENGAMQVIPGSHLRPAQHQVSEETEALLETPVEASQAVVIELPAGGCMFHHCQLLHYTAPNTTPHPRRAFALHFMIPGTKQKGTPLPVGFPHPILRMRL